MSACKNCGKECKKLFCSPSCGMKYRSYYNIDGNAKKSAEHCLECGGKTARRRNRFCSKKCYWDHHRESQSRSACKQCGNITRRTFCSHACSMLYRYSHREEYVDYFDKLAKGVRRKAKPIRCCDECGKKTSRYYNRFCSTGCAAQYRIKNKQEYEQAYSLMRNKLRKLQDRICPHCGKTYKPCDNRQKFCNKACWDTYRKGHPELFVGSSEVRKAAYRKFRNKTNVYENWRRVVSRRMTIHNPSRDPESKAKIMESNRKYWDAHPEEKAARIKRFIQAPLRCRGKPWKPTSLEKKIIELGVPGLKYVGDGSVFMTIGTKPNTRKKNPDFLLVGMKKVVEVGDVEFWHTEEEIAQTIRDYESIGYKCLYLTNRQLKDRSLYEKIVREFCGIK